MIWNTHADKPTNYSKFLPCINMQWASSTTTATRKKVVRTNLCWEHILPPQYSEERLRACIHHLLTTIQNCLDSIFSPMKAHLTPFLLYKRTWSFISDTNGLTTTTTDAQMPCNCRTFFRRLSNTSGKVTKYIDFPPPVGKITNTSRPSTELAHCLSLFCSTLVLSKVLEGSEHCNI